MKKYFCIKEYCEHEGECWFFYVEYNTRIRKSVFQKLEKVLNKMLPDPQIFWLIDTNLTAKEIDSRMKMNTGVYGYMRSHNYCKQKQMKKIYSNLSSIIRGVIIVKNICLIFGIKVI